MSETFYQYLEENINSRRIWMVLSSRELKNLGLKLCNKTEICILLAVLYSKVLYTVAKFLTV